MMLKSISIIIPVLNEVASIESTLQNLQAQVRATNTVVKTELIVVDGGSQDATLHVAEAYADQAIHAQTGRAVQMNTGALSAQGDYLLFLHSDTYLPYAALLTALNNHVSDWGFFTVRLSGQQGAFRVIEKMMTWRSTVTRIATGDQAIFVKRSVFEQHGGFTNIPLMEDIELCKRLRKYVKPLIVQEPVVTSSRRWEQFGIVNTVILMWRLRWSYFLGVSPHRLVKHYYSPKK